MKSILISFCAILIIGFYSCDKSSCTDGIKNGDESGIDCGGDCGDCLSFVGLWKVDEFTANGNNIFQTFSLENIYYDFASATNVKIVSANLQGKLTTNNTTYILDHGNNSFALSDITYTFTVESSSRVALTGIDNNNNNIKLVLKRVTVDLCNAVQCNNGTCSYGYCICNSGWQDRNCDLPVGSAGKDIAIVIYDKGQFTNGWRYIEVHKEYFIQKPWGCQNVTGLSPLFGFGKSNTEKIFAQCGNNAVAAKFALDFTIGGFSDWYLPSQSELEQICAKKSLIPRYPQAETGFWSSSDMPIDNFGNRQPVDMNSGTCQSNTASPTIGYAIYLVRYF